MANPIIPWIGGKRRLADHIIPRFPAHDCYVEVFAGGAALYFLRPPAKVEVINNVNGELINLYRVVTSSGVCVLVATRQYVSPNQDSEYPS